MVGLEESAGWENIKGQAVQAEGEAWASKWGAAAGPPGVKQTAGSPGGLETGFVLGGSSQLLYTEAEKSLQVGAYGYLFWKQMFFRNSFH